MSVKTCPRCGGDLSEDARFCRTCGTPVDKRDEHTCAGCGHVNPPDSSFCRACGQAIAAAEPEAPIAETTLVQPTPQWPPPPAGPRISAGAIAAIVVAVLLVAGGGVAAALLLTRGNTRHPTVAGVVTASTTATVTETASQPDTTQTATTGASETPTTTTTNESGETANPYSEVPQIESVLREFHEDLLSGNLQGAWELTSFRYRKEKEDEPGGYATWVTNQKTLQGHLDPSRLKVSIYGWESQSQVAAVRVTGMRWNQAGSPCKYWQGITWMRHEGNQWYYEPGYSVSPQRTAQWAGRKSQLLGWGCV